ncbi:MAG: hypothetical protein O3A53_01475 [Acidobacteria bacterium]|nr:hypothetical protein [Acidobacteriota bacterium]MDA1233451.1 hypothetical protein [Acidobacteriota bacterium]
MLPSAPQYEIQSPDLTRASYDAVLQAYTPRGDGWIELKPRMGLFIQYALFREGSTEQTLENYVGTESIRYEIEKRGELAEFGEVSRMDPRPQDALPIDQLVSKRQRKKKHHRFFYQVVIYTPEAQRVAALISSDSPEELQALAEKLQSGVPAMEDVSADNFTLLPENASAAVEFSFTVDGSPTRAIWGKRLSGYVGDSRRPKLFRLYKGEWRRVDFDPEDRESLAMPLLPGDRVER